MQTIKGPFHTGKKTTPENKQVIEKILFNTKEVKEDES